MAQIRARRIVSTNIDKGELRPITKNQEPRTKNQEPRTMQDLMTSVALIVMMAFIITLWECIDYGIKSIFKSKK